MQMQGHDQQGKMEENGTKIKGKKTLNVIQICIRSLALAASIGATWVIFTSNQTTLVYGIQMDAKYTYSSAFKFFAYANAIASVFGLLSLSLKLVLWRHGFQTRTTWLFFIHDLVVMSLLLAGCSAAITVGYIGKYGNNHTGWIPICDHFNIFCHRLMAAVILGFLSFICFLCLTILSSIKSSTTHILPFHVPNL